MPIRRKSRRQLFKKHVQTRLLIQLRIFAVIAVVMLGVVVYDIWSKILSIELAIAGNAVGFGTGFIMGKLSKVIWHEDSRQIIARMDKIGVAVIILYIGFSIFRGRIFGQFIHGPALTAVTFASVGGVMTGRLMAMVGSIHKILREQKIF